MMYKIRCEICGFGGNFSSLDKLHIIKGNNVMTNLPKIENNTVVASKNKQLPDKVRCPQCGRTISLRKIENDKDKPDGYQTSTT